MNLLLLGLFYLVGVVFSLGFWLEDCSGRDFLRPVLLSVFWPLVFVPISFSLGITGAQWFRRFKGALEP